MFNNFIEIIKNSFKSAFANLPFRQKKLSKSEEIEQEIIDDFFPQEDRDPFVRFRAVSNDIVFGIFNVKNIKYIQREIAFSTSYTQLFYVPKVQTMRIELRLADDFYSGGEDKNSSILLYGRIIYAFVLFVFFYVFLSLPNNQHQTYVRVEWKGEQDIESFYKTVLAGTLVQKDKVEIMNKIIQILNDELNKYTGDALLSITFSITKVLPSMYQNFAAGYKNYKPSGLLIEKFVGLLDVMEVDEL